MSITDVNISTSRQQNRSLTAPVTDTTTVQPRGSSTTFVVDVSLNPWVRQQEVKFVGHSLRPLRRVYYFFDDTQVTNYVQKPNIIRLTNTTDFNDTFGAPDVVSSGANNAIVLLSNPSVDFANNTLLYVSNTSGLFAAGQTVTGSRSGASATVLEYLHFSGIASAGGANSITLQTGASGTTDYYVGNTIYLTSGTGLNQTGTIAQYNATTRVVNVSSSWGTVPTSNTKYSIGHHYINKDSSVAGVFNIPSNDTLKFRTGERIFRVIDDSNNIESSCTTRGDARWVAQGLTEIKRDIIISVPTAPAPPPPSPVTPTPPPKKRDPLAQTFFVDSGIYEKGVFVSSIDLFFKTKDDTLPVTVQIRPTVNGFPHSYDVLKYAETSVYPGNVNISDNPSTSNSSTATTFTFPSPIYLEPGKEYAVIVLSDSLNYEAFVSELGQKIIGSTRVVSEQPYLGSLFKSQNSTTWTPTQLEDLMFVLKKCVFSTSAATLDFYNTIPTSNINVDSFFVYTDEDIISNTTVGYSYSKDSGGAYATIEPKTDYELTSRFTLQNTASGIFRVRASVLSTDRNLSPIIYTENYNFIGSENIINDLSINTNKITVTNFGTGYSTTANISVAISGGGGTGANAYVSNVTSGGVRTITVDTIGSGYNSSPTLTITGGTGLVNATATIASELQSSGGLSVAKYITRKVTLADGFNAGDLKVWISAYKPQGTDVLVYYKVENANDPDTFNNRPWLQMVQLTPSAATFSADKNDIVEYAYSPFTTATNILYQAGGATYITFNQFSIKIVLRSTTTVNIPIVYNMRGIALPGYS